MPGKIVHIALKVRDLESSTKFYEEVFGFRQVTTHRGKNSEHVSRHLTDGSAGFWRLRPAVGPRPRAHA